MTERILLFLCVDSNKCVQCLMEATEQTNQRVMSARFSPYITLP